MSEEKIAQEKYNELSDLGKDLYNLLYREKSSSKTHPLERYIFAIDENWDNDSALRSIAERIGIYIPPETDSAVYLYESLSDYLSKK